MEIVLTLLSGAVFFVLLAAFAKRHGVCEGDSQVGKTTDSDPEQLAVGEQGLDEG